MLPFYWCLLTTYAMSANSNFYFCTNTSIWGDNTDVVMKVEEEGEELIILVGEKLGEGVWN